MNISTTLLLEAAKPAQLLRKGWGTRRDAITRYRGLFIPRQLAKLAELRIAETEERTLMLRDAATAKAVLDLLSKAHVLLMDSLKLVGDNCSEEEHREFQAGMAHVLGRLFFLIMEPIYRDHPSLAPPDTPQDFIDSWRTGRDDQNND